MSQLVFVPRVWRLTRHDPRYTAYFSSCVDFCLQAAFSRLPTAAKVGEQARNKCPWQSCSSCYVLARRWGIVSQHAFSGSQLTPAVFREMQLYTLLPLNDRAIVLPCAGTYMPAVSIELLGVCGEDQRHVVGTHVVKPGIRPGDIKVFPLSVPFAILSSRTCFIMSGRRAQRNGLWTFAVPPTHLLCTSYTSW